MKMKMTLETGLLILIIALMLIRPSWLIDFSRSLLGKLVLIALIVMCAMRKTMCGLLAALLLICLSENVTEGFKEGATGDDDDDDTKCSSLTTSKACGKDDKCYWFSKNGKDGKDVGKCKIRPACSTIDASGCSAYSYCSLVDGKCKPTKESGDTASDPEPKTNPDPEPKTGSGAEPNTDAPPKDEPFSNYKLEDIESPFPDYNDIPVSGGDLVDLETKLLQSTASHCLNGTY